MAAELAIALPAVVLTIILGVGALAAAGRLVSMQDVAADAARLLGRGQDAAAVVAAVPDASMSRNDAGDLVCVTVRSQLNVGHVPVPLSATSCALNGGR